MTLYKPHKDVLECVAVQCVRPGTAQMHAAKSLDGSHYGL